MNYLDLPHGRLPLPAFLPDATHGFVRSADAADLEACGIQAVVMNVFHLMQRPGAGLIKRRGGLHAFSGWSRPIVTDSGGFQAFSLIGQNKKYGRITPDGIVFHPEGGGRKVLLPPEKSIRLQVELGADVVICLDHCTHSSDDAKLQQDSVELTVDWAGRCRREFDRCLKVRSQSSAVRPLIFAVVQGGASPQLRRDCAQSLLDIGFDGFGFGGYPLDREGRLLEGMLACVREHLPDRYPLFALGIGQPANVIRAHRLGFSLFDCSLPTRDARRGRLYGGVIPEAAIAIKNELFSYIYIDDEKHARNGKPISPDCDCLACARYSLSFLHHLHKIEDSLFLRLATIHNLRFMARLMQSLGAGEP